MINKKKSKSIRNYYESKDNLPGSSNGFLGSISYRHLIGSDEVLQLNHLQMYLPTLSLIVDNNQGIEFPNQSWKYWPVVWIQNEVPSLCIFTLVLNFSNRFLLIIIHKGKREWSNVVIDWFSVLLFSHDRCGCTTVVVDVFSVVIIVTLFVIP